MHALSKIATALSVLLLLFGSVGAQAEEAADRSSSSIKSSPGVVDKVANAIKRGASAAATGIEHGVKAAARGIERGASAAGKGIERGAQATARGVERGANATGNAAHRVADKVGGASSSPEPAAPVPVTDR